jgi:hypothetical protein
MSLPVVCALKLQAWEGAQGGGACSAREGRRLARGRRAEVADGATNTRAGFSTPCGPPPSYARGRRAAKEKGGLGDQNTRPFTRSAMKSHSARRLCL